MRRFGLFIVLIALTTSSLYAQLSNLLYLGQRLVEKGITFYIYDVDYNYAVQTAFCHFRTETKPDGTPMYMYTLITTYLHTQAATYNEIRGGPIGRLLDAYSEGNSFEDSQKLGRITEAVEGVNATYSTRLVRRDIVEQMLTSGILSEPQYKVKGYEVETIAYDRWVNWSGHQNGLYAFGITDIIFSSVELAGNVSVRNREGQLVYDGPVSTYFLNNGNKSNP